MSFEASLEQHLSCSRWGRTEVGERSSAPGSGREDRLEWHSQCPSGSWWGVGMVSNLWGLLEWLCRVGTRTPLINGVSSQPPTSPSPFRWALPWREGKERPRSHSVGLPHRMGTQPQAARRPLHHLGAFPEVRSQSRVEKQVVGF